jgi:hypothetical protein
MVLKIRDALWLRRMNIVTHCEAGSLTNRYIIFDTTSFAFIHITFPSYTRINRMIGRGRCLRPFPMNDKHK